MSDQKEKHDDQHEPDTVQSLFTEDHLETRRRIIESAQEIEYETEVKKRMQEMRAANIPFPPIPETLINLIEVLIPGEDAHQPLTDVMIKSETVAVPLTQRIYQRYRNRMSPFLCAEQVHKLSGDCIMEYWEYVMAYKAYLAHQHSLHKAREMSLKHRLQFLQDQFQILYMGIKASAQTRGIKLTQAQTKAYIGSEPSIMEVRKELTIESALIVTLSSRIASLKDVMDLCSRNLTRHLEEIRGLHVRNVYQKPPTQSTSPASVEKYLYDEIQK